jgi:hypothetical protein
MLKVMLILASMVFGEVAYCQSGRVDLFTYSFLHLNYRYDTPIVFHNIVIKNSAKPANNDNSNNPRSQEYYYVHNGDNLKATEDIFSGGVQQGFGWLKNFDFGKFANIVFEVRGDTKDGPGKAFDWKGKFLFFNLFNKKELPGYKHKWPHETENY